MVVRHSASTSLKCVIELLPKNVMNKLFFSSSVPQTVTGSFLLTFTRQIPTNNFVRYTTRLVYRVGITRRSKMEMSKPPNIFIYTGEDDESARDFQGMKETFQQCLNPDRYVIYHLQKSKLFSIPWEDNTVALVVSSMSMSKDVLRSFQNFACSGGNVLSLCSPLTLPGVTFTETKSSAPFLVSFCYRDWPQTNSYRGPYEILCIESSTYEVLARDSSSGAPVILKFPTKKGTAVFSQVFLAVDAVRVSRNVENFNALKASEENCLKCLSDILSVHLGLDCSKILDRPLTPIHLISRFGESKLMDKLIPHMHGNLLQLRHVNLTIKESLTNDVDKIEIDSPYPVILSSNNGQVSGFNCKLFFENLGTHLLGTVVFYTNTVTSTMDLLEGLPVDIGAVSIADIQTKGKGRGGNTWLSPKGCAMFSAQVCVGRDSHLGQGLPLIQQLATLAVLLAIKTLPGGYKELDVGLKWPNDIYYAKRIKIGGVLVNTTMQDNTFCCYIGCGVNLDNNLPTVCLNDLIILHNKMHGTQMHPLSMEMLVARTLTQLERLISCCQQYGTASCMNELYSHWIHDQQTLLLEVINEIVTVQGIDSFGFLCVQRLQGQTLTLHPDGNSLDQMKNLLIAKT